AAAPLEPLLDALIADADDGLLLVDPERRIARANPAALRLLSVSRARALGSPAAALVRSVVRGDDPIDGAYRAAHVEHETVIIGRAGGEVPVRVRSLRVGRPPWVLLALRDLTQARRARQQLRRNERLATLGQLSAAVEVAPRLSPVYVDSDLATQVLLNVTLNAVQAMPHGGALRYEIRRVRRPRPPRGPGRRAGDARAPARGGGRWIEAQQIRVSD